MRSTIPLLLAALAAACIWWWLSPPGAPLPDDKEIAPSKSDASDAHTERPASTVTSVVREAPAPSASEQRSKNPGPTTVAARLGGNAGEAELFQYFNRVLTMEGKPTIPESAIIEADELRRFLDAVRDTRRETERSEMLWREAASVRSQACVREIQECLADGRIPPYAKLPPTAPMPKVARDYDLISIHMPAGTTDRYVVNLFEEYFPAELEGLRRAKAARLQLFDEALRPLFVTR